MRFDFIFPLDGSDHEKVIQTSRGGEYKVRVFSQRPDFYRTGPHDLESRVFVKEVHGCSRGRSESWRKLTSKSAIPKEVKRAALEFINQVRRGES